MIHLPGRCCCQVVAREARDQMKAHADPGRDAGGRNDAAFVNPARAVNDINVREAGLQVGDVLPVRRSATACQQACPGRDERACAD